MVLGEKRRRIVTKFELAGSPQLLYQRPDLITVEARERIAKQHESRLVYPTRITERTHEVLAQQLTHQLVLLGRGSVETHGDLPRYAVIPPDHTRVQRRTVAAQTRAARLADHAQRGVVRPRAHDKSAGGHRDNALRVRTA